VATEVFSHSRLSSFEDCPRKFAFRYVEKVAVDTESIEAFVGKRVHEVLERLYQFTGRGAVPSLGKVLDRFRALWDEHYAPARIRIAREGLAPGDYRANGERCLTNYYRRHYPFDHGETLAVEERVTFSLDGEGRYRVQGVIDRIVRAPDDAIEIHDYKTGARVPAQEKLDQDRQLALYQMGVAQRFGDEAPIRLVWHYLLSDQLRTSTRTPDALDALRRATIERIDEIRAARTFEPRPSALCRWCEYVDLCPAGRERVGGPGLEPPHPAEELPAPAAALAAAAAVAAAPAPVLGAAGATPAAAAPAPRANASGQLRLL
jgi:putative RecB family exonuclease